MKKLIIAAAIVCAAVVSQAAAMKWTATNVYSDKTGTTKASGYSAYAFLASASAGSEATLAKVTSIAAITALLADDGDVNAVIAKSLSKGAVNNGLANISTTYGDDKWDNTTSQSTFAIIFNNADATKATEFLVVPAGGTATAVTFTDKDNSKTVAFGSQASNLGWTAVAAVPEPTSGLLLLLGIAGLALKRKRA